MLEIGLIEFGVSMNYLRTKNDKKVEPLVKEIGTD